VHRPIFAATEIEKLAMSKKLATSVLGEHRCIGILLARSPAQVERGIAYLVIVLVLLLVIGRDSAGFSITRTSTK
jgi:hypothetical protein